MCDVCCVLCVVCDVLLCCAVLCCAQGVFFAVSCLGAVLDTTRGFLGVARGIAADTAAAAHAAHAARHALQAQHALGTLGTTRITEDNAAEADIAALDYTHQAMLAIADVLEYEEYQFGSILLSSLLSSVFLLSSLDNNITT